MRRDRRAGSSVQPGMTGDTPAPFRISVPQAVLDDLARRLAAFRPPPSPEAPDWKDGMRADVLAELVEYWRTTYDWRAQEAALNALPQFRAACGPASLHFVHVEGRGPAPMPLLLAHGWPDGFNRFSRIIPLLTDPGAHGGDPADAFTVVAPSLPGYGFSPRAAHGTGAAQFGAICHTLMTEVLGFARYGAHGGDIGSMVCEQLGRDHAEAVVGVHLTDVPLGHAQTPSGAVSAAETRYLAAVQRFRAQGGGYMHIQGTRPWTPAAALNDSPAGLLAWMVEKFQAWSDCGDDPRRRYTPDELITNVMLYWVTQSIGTSFLAYRDFTKPGRARAAIEGAKALVAGQGPGPGTGPGAPAGFALFPKDIASPPREWAERFFDVRHWTEMPAGGHFAALEEPGRLAADLRAFFRPLRPAR